MPEDNVSIKRQVIWYVAGDLEVGTGKSAYVILPMSGNPVQAVAHCGTAPTGTSATFNIMINSATTLLSSVLTVADGATLGTNSGFAVTAFNANDVLTLDILQVGSTTTGADATVLLEIDGNG